MYAQIDFEQLTVAEVAVQFPAAVSILQEHNIDFCCGGKIPFTQACARAGVNPEAIWEQVIHSSETGSGSLRVDSWEERMLVDFIENNHHKYVRKSIPEIKGLLEKVCAVHGENHPELHEVNNHFSAISDELLQHMQKEEIVLFPAIRDLFGGNRSGYDLPSFLETPMEVMEHEHQEVGDLIKSIRSLTHSYTPPADACPTFRVTYKMLQDFDQDLMQHIHLENNVLFRKVRNVSSK